ncbi:MAG: helicase-related protein, partial [Notoacmeibacter sp.]
ERSNALQSMRDGRSHVCVATDVAARGIDLPNLDLVIHADVPTNPETLLHRSGRTGRAGRKGICVLIVPENKRSAAQRVLAFAKLTATTRAAPGIADIEARYRRRIIEAANSSEEPSNQEREFVAELLNQVGPHRIAAAFLRQQMASRPVPEELIPLNFEYTAKTRSSRDGRPDGENAPMREWVREPRGERGPDMEGGVWFTISLGRKQRADPKFLLPMICNAGKVTKRDVGSIKIEDTKTRFEISAGKAASYAQQIKQPGSLERGIIIVPAGELPEQPKQSKPKFSKAKKPVGEHPGATEKRSDKLKQKSRKPKRPA